MGGGGGSGDEPFKIFSNSLISLRWYADTRLVMAVISGSFLYLEVKRRSLGGADEQKKGGKEGKFFYGFVSWAVKGSMSERASMFASTKYLRH